MIVETYSHVIHIVSHVAGRLREDVGPMDALRSMLPAGTLSGAPKVRPMEIIDEVEPVTRGAYGRAVGSLSYCGAPDTRLCIRTGVVKAGVRHFPTGAPKVRAMEISDEVEPVKRGAYGGAVGYLSYGGDLDTCICIRTVVVKDGVAHVQAGGGTVADARPDYEYEESRAKARGVLRAIETACEQGWA